MNNQSRIHARRTLAGHGTPRRKEPIALPAVPSTDSASADPGDSPQTADPMIAAAPVLYTPDQAAQLLQVRPSWLRRKAAARAIPCRYLGKHLRFTRADIEKIAEGAA